MKSMIMMTALGVFLVSANASVSAKTTCEEVREKIENKIRAKGVKAFTLTIVPKDEKTELRVVGTCDGGAKKIIYKRG